MILEPPKIKSDTVSTVTPSISHEVMGPDVIMGRIIYSPLLFSVLYLKGGGSWMFYLPGIIFTT